MPAAARSPFGETGQHQLIVWRPGTYGMRVIDSQVHWIEHQRLIDRFPSRTEELALNDGSTSTFVAERRWQDYIRPKFGLQQETPFLLRKLRYQLAWFGRGSLGFESEFDERFSP